MEIHELTLNNIDDVMDIQRECYYAIIPESREAMRRKVELCPEGCFGVFSGSRVLGYILSHPWRFGETPLLNEVITALPASADSWYLHDVAITPELRGSGTARKLVKKALAVGAEKCFRRAHIVSIQGSGGFFAALGFAAAEFRPDPSYGEDAEIMFVKLP